MIEKTSWTRVTLEGYNFETQSDQILFFNPTERNGNNTWNGMALPSLCIFETAENGPVFGVGLRSIYYNGAISVDGLTATVNPVGMRIIDPAAYPIYNGWISEWSGFNGASNLYIDWGDGSEQDNVALTTEGIDPAPQHVYAEAGTYTVTTTGNLAGGGAPSVTLDIVVVEP